LSGRSISADADAQVSPPDVGDDAPGSADRRAADALVALLGLMRRLRDRERGCPWDRAQDFASIAPYTIEEAYEVADAIARQDMPGLRDELGDLLFQVVFHAQMAQEAGQFDFAAVAQAIAAKLERRHPHIFEGVPIEAARLPAEWEAQKARERAAAGAAGVLRDVPLALPALTRAAKLGKRAARVGFDWPDTAGVRAKVAEELQEVDAAVRCGDAAAVAEEMGDLLFAIANWARHLHTDAEEALRQAGRKFEQRFERMERWAQERGLGALSALSAAQWDVLWNEAKNGREATQP
jgi:nucleoside triphosphate diphosphatase